MTSVLQLKSVTKSFTQGGAELEVLKGVDIALEKKESVALLGASGSGKTTLLQIAGLLSTPSGGQVLLEGQDVSKAGDRERTRWRRGKIGFVFQFHHLLPEFTALENVILPQLLAGKAPHEAERRAIDLLDVLGAGGRLEHRPAQLSGGEQQRVAIARALANDPALILADEPTGNLDARTAERVFQLLTKVAEGRGVAVLVATHNTDLASRLNRTLRLKDGKIVQP